MTDVKGGLQMIPQLPLELALVESVMGTAEPEASSQITDRQELALSTPPAPSPAAPKTEGRRVAESSVPDLTPTPAPPAPAQSTGDVEPVVEAQTSSGQLTLEVVERVWEQVLVAVRQRNPTAEGALRSGCTPVEVTGNQVVVTFPYPFLRDKLGDPQRKVEVQDALSEVLGTSCHVKLVLASDYQPGLRAAPGPSEPVPDTASPQPALDAEDLGQLTRWAEKHGGETKVIEEP